MDMKGYCVKKASMKVTKIILSCFACMTKDAKTFCSKSAIISIQLARIKAW